MSSSRSSGVTFALPPPTLTVPEVMKALIQFIGRKIIFIIIIVMIMIMII